MQNDICDPDPAALQLESCSSGSSDPANAPRGGGAPFPTAVLSVYVVAIGNIQTRWPSCRCCPASGSPKCIEFSSVKEVLLSVKAVKSMHCLHLWALTLGQSLVSVHLAIGNTCTPTVFWIIRSVELQALRCSALFGLRGRGGPSGRPAGGHGSADRQVRFPQHHHPGGALQRRHEPLLPLPGPQRLTPPDQTGLSAPALTAFLTAAFWRSRKGFFTCSCVCTPWRGAVIPIIHVLMVLFGGMAEAFPEPVGAAFSLPTQTVFVFT